MGPPRRRLAEAATLDKALRIGNPRRHMTILRSVAAALLVMIAVAWPLPPAGAETLGQVFKRVNRSVVLVRTRETDVEGQGPGTLTSLRGLGSGVLVSADGKVMTAAHIVQTADEVTVEFLTGGAVRARVIASEPSADVSLLQLERVPEGAHSSPLGDSDKVDVGDQIFIIGAPYGISHTLTVGHVSGRHRPNTIYSELATAEFLQTDAAINQGNSGGPMFNLAGEVVGIVSHIISKSGGFEGLGFVVTSNMARTLLLERRSFWSGVQGFVLRDHLAKIFNVPQSTGVLVQRVAAGSPAERTGLRPGTRKATIDGQTFVVGGDIILSIGSVQVGEPGSRERILALRRSLVPGSTLTIVVLRDGQRVELTSRVDPTE
jgi:S1-C subfamily serine protease